MSKTLDLLLAEHFVQTGYADIPAEALSVAKRSILDAIGVSLGASGLDTSCQAIMELARESGGVPQATVIGAGFKTSAAMAAMANGSMAHALDFEDVHDEAIGHPNASSVPAALAIAELRGDVTGEEFIAAIALGADLYCRLSASIRQRHNFDWYIAGVLSVVSASATAAKLLRLNETQFLDAISLAFCQATMSWELKYSPESHIRGIREAFFAKGAVMGALMAEKGVKGFDEPIGGKAGFLALYAHGDYDRDKILGDLGKRYDGATVSFKPWPSCRGSHSFIECAVRIARDNDIAPEAIDKITAIGSKLFRNLMEPAEQKLAPATAINAKFSLPFTVATALRNRAVLLRHFTPEAMKDTETLALGHKVDYRVNPDLKPSENSVGRLEVRTKDGKVFGYGVETPFGHPRNAMTEDALIAKFRDCASHAAKPLSAARLDRLIAGVLSLETTGDAADIGRWLAPDDSDIAAVAAQ